MNYKKINVGFHPTYILPTAKVQTQSQLCRIIFLCVQTKCPVKLQYPQAALNALKTIKNSKGEIRTLDLTDSAE